MRIQDTDKSKPAPRNIHPLVIALFSLFVGALFGVGLMWMIKPNTPAKQCANVIHTADNIIHNYNLTLETYDQLISAISLTGSRTLANQAETEIDVYNAQRTGYIDYYNQQKGACS